MLVVEGADADADDAGVDDDGAAGAECPHRRPRRLRRRAVAASVAAAVVQLQPANDIDINQSLIIDS